MKNAMSIDLEDWFCVHNMSQVIDPSQWGQCELRVVDSTRRLLEVLAKHRVKATFFVLGWVAECACDLIREVAEQGHEIASHGYSHTLLTQMTPKSFEEDLQRSVRILKSCVGQEILGFRAPPSPSRAKPSGPWTSSPEMGFAMTPPSSQSDSIRIMAYRRLCYRSTNCPTAL